MQSIAREAGIPYRTAQRWVAQYRRFGLAALSRKKREDRGERRAVSKRLKEIIEGLALQKPPLPISALYRQVVRFSKDLNETAPSYGTVFNIVRSLGADPGTLAHEGTKAYSETFELVHRREAASPNAIWQADHAPLDIWLIRPPCTPRWHCARRYGVKRIRVGLSAASQRFCTPITEATSPRTIWNRSARI